MHGRPLLITKTTGTETHPIGSMAMVYLPKNNDPIKINHSYGGRFLCTLESPMDSLKGPFFWAF